MGGGTVVSRLDASPQSNNNDHSIRALRHTSLRTGQLPSSSSLSTSPSAFSNPKTRLCSTKAASDLRSAASSWSQPQATRASIPESATSQTQFEEESNGTTDRGLDSDRLENAILYSQAKLPDRLTSTAAIPSTARHIQEDQIPRSQSTRNSTQSGNRSLHLGSGSSNLSAAERRERRRKRHERLDRPLPPPPLDADSDDGDVQEKNEEFQPLPDPGNLRRALTNPGPSGSIDRHHLKKERSKYLPCDIYSNLHRLAEQELSRYGDYRGLSSADPPLIDISAAIVLSIVQSRRYRDRLEHMINCLDTANPPKVAEAIAKDEPQVEKLLIKVLNSDSERKAALSLRGHDAELFMDVLQNFELDHHTDRPDLAKDARKLLVSLSKLSTNLPETMFISGVEPVKERNVHGGTFGDVYRSFFEGRPVALKRLRIFQRSDESEKKALYKRFCREALIWQTLRHEFVLPFLGIDAENFPRQPCMVSPWMSNGTLNHFLKKNPKANIDKLLFEIAQGIDYLHSQSIVHGDIKGVNILIDEYWKPHLADFGLTLFADATRQNTTDMGGTLRWMAPELFDESAPCRRTSASDIYAYGCLCIEAYTGKPPYQEIRGELQVIGLVKSGIRPSRPTGSSTMTDGLWELVNACWHQDSSSRLKSNMVVEGLRTILRQSAIDNSQHSTSPLLNAHSSASLGSGRRLSSYSNPAEEVVKRNIMSSQDQAEFARCLKRIRHHADPGRMYRDIKILRYNSSIKFSEAAIRGTNSKVTIKQFRTSSQDVKTLRRLVDEFHDMRYLHHANLINYIDLFQHESDIWVVLEGIHKTISLKKVISANVSRDAGLKESFIATVLRNVGQALHYLHRHAINHGNINSEEILLSYIGKSILVRLKLGAMLEDTDITRTSICPPEIVDSGEEGRSAAADVWSLGVLAIEMFDSTVDISLPSSVLLEHMRNSNPRPSALMLDFLEQILQIDPRKRPVIASLLQNSFLQK